MAPSGRTYPLHGYRVAITVAFIFSLFLLLPKSGGLVFSDSRDSLEESRVVIGSKPPACVNKCMNCRPCMATVVVPNHQRKGFKVLSHGDDDRYYLLSWKCRCGDKLFQP
ncbi:Epidermal patterning factor protein [Sesbania bispinosa]|nr:Epidermal patterning factor protein [Sesbania bispinosa]